MILALVPAICYRSLNGKCSPELVHIDGIPSTEWGWQCEHTSQIKAYSLLNRPHQNGCDGNGSCQPAVVNFWAYRQCKLPGSHQVRGGQLYGCFIYCL